jgi:hypothetical protein
MAAELYTNAAVYIQGALLLQATSVTIDRKTGAQPQLTLAGGFVGMSPGAPMMEISFANAVPSAGMEFDPGEFMKLLSTTAFTIFAGNRSLTTTGFVTEDSFKKAANSEAVLDIKMTCVFAEWQ